MCVSARPEALKLLVPPVYRRAWKQLDKGDVLLFYVGDRTYRYAADVLGTEGNEALANELWPDFATTTTGGDDPHDPWRWIIYLDEPVQVDIAGAEIHGYAGHDRDFTVRFMRLNDQGHTELRRRFGSVDGFIDERVRASDPESSDNTDTETGGSYSHENSPETVADLKPPERTDVQISRVVRNTAMVRELKQRYNHQCQLCGMQRQRSSSEQYAEGHHLHPLGDSPPGPDAAANVLVLCPNHHADFDHGLVRIDPDNLEITHQYDSDVDGRKLHLRNDHPLARDHLEYHNSDIASF